LFLSGLFALAWIFQADLADDELLVFTYRQFSEKL